MADSLFTSVLIAMDSFDFLCLVNWLRYLNKKKRTSMIFFLK